MRFPVRLAIPDDELLYGDFGDWLRPLAGPGGTFVTEVPSGLYGYKFRSVGAPGAQRAPDEGWRVPDARTRAVGGVRNAVLSLGGTPEPLLFAGGAPCVRESADGALEIVAWLRRGNGETLFVLWHEEGAQERASVAAARTAAERIDEEDEHLVFRALLPCSARSVTLAFELADGRIVEGEAGPMVVRRAPRGERLPSWLGSLYTILVDRFRPWPVPETWGEDPGPDVAAGGTLEGVTRSLDHLRSLGVAALHLTPVHVGASCHRYDLVDPLRVDPALGGDEGLRDLVRGAHARDLRVLVDFSFVHVGEGFPPYEDVRAHGRSSRYAAWFRWDEAGELRHYGFRKDAPLLDLDNAEVVDLALRTVDFLASFGIDGLRFDAIADVPMAFARAVRERLRARNPEAIVFGELVPPHLGRWRDEGALDVGTSFGFHAAATRFVVERSFDAGAFVAATRRAEAARGVSDDRAVHFLSTHDHPRVASLARLYGDGKRAPLGTLLLLAWAGIPAFVYGEEHELSCAAPVFEPEHGWGDRMPMRWDRGPSVTGALLRTLLPMRSREPALARGRVEILAAEGPLLAFRRSAGESVVDVVVNASDERLEVSLEDDERPIVEVLAGTGDVGVLGSSFTLGPNGGVVARRLRGEAKEAARRAERLALPMVRDRAFAQGALRVPMRPLRMDLSVTERCNLRCAHCITAAPEKTARGSARTLTTAVLDRLRDDLSFASWLGFTHGGESLVAPVLFEVLEAIRVARAGAPTTVHLLTNGKLLTRATSERLFAAGVTSLFVSLDGASGATNDRVRIGGDFQNIVRNVRDAVDARQALGADVRVGLSYVVMRSNLRELETFVELASSLRVDWVKFEDLAPVTGFAAAELVDSNASELRDALARACERGRSLGLVVVDHTDPSPVVACDRDPRVRAFLDADSFANRFDMNPCRSAWERVCIEPSGDVRLDDFTAPVVGNVLATPLVALWNGAAAEALRSEAVARRPCEGRVTCVP